MIFEMGKSVLKFEDGSVSLTRVKLQWEEVLRL
jgi:hypothetical protein